MSYSALSDSFEYLCYGSAAIRNIFYSHSAGMDFSRQNLSTKVDPRTVRVMPAFVLTDLKGVTFK